MVSPTRPRGRNVRIETRADLEHPVATVYDMVADLAWRNEWLAEVTEVQAEPPAPTEGAEFRAVASILLHDFHGLSTITCAQRAQRFTEDVTLGARFISDWQLEPGADGGTRLTHVVDIEFPAGPFGWIERWVLGRRLRRMQNNSLDRLAEVLGR